MPDTSENRLDGGGTKLLGPVSGKGFLFKFPIGTLSGRHRPVRGGRFSPMFGSPDGLGKVGVTGGGKLVFTENIVGG